VYSPLSELVTTALGQRKLSGLSDMLKGIAKALDSYGCILWQVAPGSRVKTLRGSLQVLAEWFPDGQESALSSLPLDQSVTGEAVRSQQPASIMDISDSRVYADPFLTAAGIRTFCSLPIRFSDGTLGSLNLYRNAPRPFEAAEIELATGLAALVPELYQAIRDRVSFNLVHEVHEILHEAEPSASDPPPDVATMNQVIRRICELVSESFQCIETSVFLEDRLIASAVYKLAATTWPDPISKRSYRPDPGDGLTGWVLAHAKPVNITNLSLFKKDRKRIQREYPGLTWNDPLHLEESVRRLLPTAAGRWLPLSFLAVPIVRGDRVFGVIRCSVTERGPYFFARQEENLLTLVAAQIGRSWSSWLNRREIEEENRTWKAVVESIQELNSFVLRELSGNQPKENRIFGEALRVTTSLIGGAEIMDVRLVDEAAGHLYFAETHGDAWFQGEPQILQQRRNRRFPLGDLTQPSAGAHVVETGEVYLIPDVRTDEYYSETFPKTRRMIVAPMVSVAKQGNQQPKVLGVLDIRGADPGNFPRHARHIAGLLGSQLGLYHDLAMTIGGLQRLQEEQIQTFQDLKHQFKSPTVQAHRRVELALKLPALPEELRDRLLQVRGLTAKAMRVSMNIELFANLAKGKALLLTLAPLSADDLVKLLIEAGMDNRLMVDPKRRIRFKVESSGIERITALMADRDLLEQAINDLLDNAFKYSYADTSVRILGGLTGTGRPHLTFVNTGIPIHAHDLPRCVERGWQSEEARSVSGGGSGIGLWIVSHIMQAHHGELQILPTRANDETEIKLLFPKSALLRS
jgi:signal transduction histidine kinase